MYLERNLRLLFGDPTALREVIENTSLQESAIAAIADPALVRFPYLDHVAFIKWRSELKKRDLDKPIRRKTSFRRNHTV